MITIGIVSFGFENKRECKKIAQRIKTVTRQLQSYTHPVIFNRIEAADFNLNKNDEKEDWIKAISKHDGFVFLIPKHSEGIIDDLFYALGMCSSELANKPLLVIYYGVEDKYGQRVDIIEMARSFEMPVLYNSVILPYLDHKRATAFELFQQTEDKTASEIEKLLYWTMGMKYTRTMLRQEDNGAS